jgi:dTDP-4-dehydrorhamnose reductase
MRNLILGATGLIGSHLLANLTERAEPVLGTGYQNPSPELVPLDIRDKDAVQALMEDYQPEVTYYCIGCSDPRTAELDPEGTRALHLDGLRTIVEIVAAQCGELVLFTPDAVLAATRAPRAEDAPLDPVGVWASTHAEAEALVRERLPDQHWIVRTSWVFAGAEHDRGAAGRVIAAAQATQAIRVGMDIYGQPTNAADLADATVELVKSDERGTIHITGPDRHTELTFARLVYHIWGCDTDLIETDPRAAERWSATVRPWLDRSKLRQLLGSRAIASTADALRQHRPIAWEQSNHLVAIRVA